LRSSLAQILTRALRQLPLLLRLLGGCLLRGPCGSGSLLGGSCRSLLCRGLVLGVDGGLLSRRLLCRSLLGGPHRRELRGLGRGKIAPEGLDFAQLDPMVSAAEQELKQAGVSERPEVVLADAGYWSNEHIDRLRERGITHSSPRMRTAARDREGRASAAPTTSCEGRSKRRRARSSTPGAREWSSRCSPTSSKTDARGASNAGAGRPFGRNGA